MNIFSKIRMLILFRYHLRKIEKNAKASIDKKIEEIQKEVLEDFTIQENDIERICLERAVSAVLKIQKDTEEKVQALVRSLRSE